MKPIPLDNQTKPPLLARIGGPAAVAQVAQLLYAAVITDDLLSDYFQGCDLPDLERRQGRFLNSLLAETMDPQAPPGAWAAAKLTKAHAPLVQRGLGDSHFERLLDLMDQCLSETGADVQVRQDIRAHLNSQRNAVLGAAHDLSKPKEQTMTGRIFGMSYAIFCYLAGMASLLYIGGWLVGIGVPRALDDAPSTPFDLALLINTGLVALFALQHSVMARPWFKAAWTKIIPPALERSTYVLCSAVATFLMTWFWEPLGIEIWHLTGNAAVLMYAAFGLGALILVSATFYLNHFELFGLRQAWLQLRGLSYTPIPFATPGMYRWVRHPIYTGWFILIWAAPVMTVSHLAFALMVTAYTLMAIPFEERDLSASLPEYEEYKTKVPAIIPGLQPKV